MSIPEEPKLSYGRILNDLSTIVQSDTITSTCLHSKFFVIGTLRGRIYVLDHQGNKVNGQDIFVHSKSVNSICIDEKGEYLVSCSLDRLVVYGLCSSEYNFVLMPDKPVNVVAIDPFFHFAGTGRKFVAGGDRVVLYERGFLSKYKSTVLQSREQKVRTISWHDQFVAWATDIAVQVFDADQRTIITRIKRDNEADGRQAVDICQLCWKDRRTLLIGWSNTVKVCLIKERGNDVLNDSQLRELPKKYVEIISMFETDFNIQGLAPFKENLLTLSIHKSSKPQLQILETFSNSYNELARDILTPKNLPVNPKGSSPYQLLSLHEDGIYFIVCTNDVLFAKPRDSDDHFEWLVEHSQLKECYLFAKEDPSRLVRHSVREIEELYMDDLLENGRNYEMAASLTASFCGTDQKAWDEALQKYIDLDQLKHLLPHLPIDSNKFVLTTESYDLIMENFLENDPVSFFKAIKRLPSKLYSFKKMTDQVIKFLANDPKNLVLNEALAELYICEGKFEDAVNIYLDYNDKNKIFPLIRNNKLVYILENRVDKLMQIDANETSQILVENIDSIPMKRVVERLERLKSRQYLVSYLHRLFLKDPNLCSEYYDLMVKLYAQHQRGPLLNFLKSSTSYSLEEALRVCKEANLFKEVVFLRSRMGDLRGALKYIIESQSNINEAIEFCQEHEDRDLWRDLILYYIAFPEHIVTLLNNVDLGFIDPIELIDMIPNEFKDDGLTPALVKILLDYRSQLELERISRDIEADDCFSLLEKQLRVKSKAVEVRVDHLCDYCHQLLIPESIRQASLMADAGQISQADLPSYKVVVFQCHHVFHVECCPDSVENGAEKPTKTCRVCMSETDYDN